MNIVGLKELIGTTMLIGFGLLVAIYLIHMIIENKTKRVKKQQIKHRAIRVSEIFDCDGYIRANYKTSYIGETKNIKADLIYVLNH